MAISIVFCGTPDFAVPSLKALASDPAFDVQLVITQPDRPIGRKGIITAPPVKVLALELGIPVVQPEKLNRELEAISQKLQAPPDFLVVVAYGQILNDAVLAWPTKAPVNVHGSLLPRWRGASPIQHAVLMGDKETGVTIQIMVKELDAGPILSQTKIAIDNTETLESLFEKLAPLGADLLVKTLKDMPEPQPQPSSGITMCTKLDREDGVVDSTTMTAEEIDRRVRALNPWPSVTMTIGDQVIKILKTSLLPRTGSAPIPCKNNTTLHLVEIQPAGRKAMSAADWMRGRANTL